MSARDTILGKVRSALHAGPADAARRKAVEERLKKAAPGVVPARGQLPPAGRVALFAEMAQKLSATVEHVRRTADVPQAITEYLRGKNLPSAVRMGADPRLAAMPWAKQRALELRFGPSDGDDEAGVSHATAAIAETGTLVMVSGADNPTTVNFLPDHHIVVRRRRRHRGRPRDGAGAYPRRPTARARCRAR